MENTEQSKPNTCSMCPSNSACGCCKKMCPGCLLHKILRILIVVVALTVAFCFGEKVGMIKSMFMGDAMYGYNNHMMIRHEMMDDRMMAPKTEAAAPAATATAPVKK